MAHACLVGAMGTFTFLLQGLLNKEKEHFEAVGMQSVSMTACMKDGASQCANMCVFVALICTYFFRLECACMILQAHTMTQPEANPRGSFSRKIEYTHAYTDKIMYTMIA
jgi:hypothetical protein